MKKNNFQNIIMLMGIVFVIGIFSGCSDDSLDNCEDGCLTKKTGCNIKGNISYKGGEKIYHVPGQEYYNDTKIDSNYGERWFCNETDARKSGWRKAKN